MALIINGIKVAGIGANGVDGAGVPAGGTTGQMLVKKTDIDHDTEWVDLPSTDSTLKIEGLAADAKATGDLIDSNMITIGSTYETKEDASDKLVEAKIYTDEQIVSSVADWNQNDETAPDYIKNKPFGKETITQLLYAEQSITTSKDSDEADYAYAEIINGNFTIAEGQIYIVVFNGIAYECTAWESHKGDWPMCIGNGYGEPYGNNEPFKIYGFNDGYNNYIRTKESGTYTVAVFEKIGETIKKIDEKYLPDAVKAQSDWNQNDETAPDYVKNRFGGYYENTYSTVLEETTLEFEPYTSDNGYYTYIDDYNIAEMLFGSKPTVRVTFDDVVYEKAFDKNSGFDSDETIPFGFYVQIADGAHLHIDTILEGDTHTVKIEKVEKLPVTISEEFLPDSVKVQPDWSQNDESAPDYVKNRPGGYIETFDVEVISESTVEFTELTKYPQQYVYTSPILIGYDPEQYKVVIDDVEYILTRTKNRVNCYGNGSLSNFGGEDTGEPILLYTDVNADTGDEWTSIYTTIEGLSHTIAVYRIEETPVIIDEKFLPDFVKSLVVTITGNSTDGYTSDTTFAEIQTAFKAGKMVYADISSSWIPLDSVVYTRKRYMLTYLDEDLYARFRNISTIGNTVSYFGELTIDYNNIVSIDTSKNCVSKSYVDTAIETAIGAAIGGSY